MSQPDLKYADREVVLRADFEDVDADGLVDVSVRFMRGPRPPQEGEHVFLKDPSGEGRLGRVVAIHGWIARVAIVDDQPAP
jgi:hypothetical protein